MRLHEPKKNNLYIKIITGKSVETIFMCVSEHFNLLMNLNASIY